MLFQAESDNLCLSVSICGWRVALPLFRHMRDNGRAMDRKKPRGRSQDMFSAQGERLTEREAPLAARMRPRSFEEFVGQEHLVGEGRVLRRVIDADQLPSIILWGPPGSGKTTLDRTTAGPTRAQLPP